MLRLNIVLCILAVLCALALVTAQHEARQLFSQLSKEEEATKQIEVEWGQLQLEQSTWAMHARIEKIAARNLGMRVPPAARTQVVPPAAAEDVR